MGNQFCGNCGAPVTEGQAFCGKCGQKVAAEEQMGASAQPQPAYAPYIAPAPSPYYARPKNSGTALIVLASAFILLAAAVLVLVFVLGPADVKPQLLNGELRQATLKTENIFNYNTDYFAKSDLGDTETADIMLKLNGAGLGTLTLDSAQLDAACKNGKIAAEAIQDQNLKIRLDGAIHKAKDGYTIEGTWKATIVKGIGRGELAQGTWKAVQAGSAVAEDESPGGSLAAKDLEGTWKGPMTLAEVPGLDANPNLTEDVKQTIRESIGNPIDSLFVFKDGILWVGDPQNAVTAPDSEKAAVSFEGNRFKADIKTEMGLAHVEGELVQGTLKGQIDFEGVPYSDTVKLPVKASFSAQKQ